MNRLALVTGGAHRVGRAIALELARAGYDLLIHYNQSAAPAEATAAEIRALGREAATLAADLGDPAALDGLFDAIAARWGRLDALVNSAAIFPRTPVGSVTVAQWDELMAVNLRAPFFCAQRAAALMPDGGVIINIADVGGEIPWAGFVPYGMSKAGILMMTRGLAAALAPRIRVGAVAPGPVLMADGTPPDQVALATRRTLLKRVGTAEDVAQAVRFIAEAPYLTGETIVIDGGRRWG